MAQENDHLMTPTRKRDFIELPGMIWAIVAVTAAIFGWVGYGWPAGTTIVINLYPLPH
jgi:hypothetical protein